MHYNHLNAEIDGVLQGLSWTVPNHSQDSLKVFFRQLFLHMKLPAFCSNLTHCFLLSQKGNFLRSLYQYFKVNLHRAVNSGKLDKIKH